jgi:hypothetical protein
MRKESNLSKKKVFGRKKRSLEPLMTPHGMDSSAYDYHKPDNTSQMSRKSKYAKAL